MSCYCINPLCEQRQNPDDAEFCLSCGSPLVINNRIRLIKPLRELEENPFVYNEIFEVEDAGTEWIPGPKRRVMKIVKWSSANLVRFVEREALALQLIHHPNIPQTYGEEDFFTYSLENSPFKFRCLLMDKIEGEDLEEWINSHPPISQTVALDWLRQLVEILDVVHHTEFFHRDIKPANIILQPDGQLALIDFGTARRINETYLAKVSASGGTDRTIGQYEITTVVSHFYTALEQIRGKAVPQSDFYALGRTIVRLVTGVRLMDIPVDRNTDRLMWRNKAPQIDKPLADLIDNLIAPNPVHRPQTTGMILEQIKRIPQKIKIYKVTNSKFFIFGVAVLGSSLLGLGIYRIGLSTFANNLVVEGQKLENANLSEKAQRMFDQAVKLRPELRFQISRFYFDKAARVKDDSKAEKKYYESAVRYNPLDVDSYNNLAVVCQLIEDINCVTQAYENLFKLEPNIWEGHYNLGNFYEAQDKYNLAQEQYKLAIKYGKGQATNAINNLSRLNILQQKYPQAVQLAKEGLKNTPDSNKELKATLYKNLGWAMLMQKKYPEADEYLQKAFELDSQRVDVYCLLAKTREALGDIEYASSYGEMCLLARTDKGYLPEIQKWREELLSRIFKKQ
ncbi:MAG: protein kinase [Nostoc sp. TH1S01]|nr:protein kinase [Nostoc sp. TH1S01]